MEGLLTLDDWKKILEGEKFVTSRSAIITYHRCPRERFLNYHALLTGVVSTRMNINTTFGSCAHHGRAVMLAEEDPEKAVVEALSLYKASALSKELAIGENEDQLFVYEEQLALLETLLWTWWFIQYPRLKEEYEVVTLPGTEMKAIEKEINWPLSPQGIMMSTADCVFRGKVDQALYVDSFKTASYDNTATFDEDGEKVDKNKYDDQGISEMIAVERLFGEEVRGIRMEFFIKGPRKKSAYYGDGSFLSSGGGGAALQRKQQQTPLIHPWKMDTGLTTEYATQWSWEDEEGKKRTLSAKSWKRVDIWKEGEFKNNLKGWVERLMADGKVAEMERMIITPFPYMRNDEDVNNWIEQNAYQEEDIYEKLKVLKGLEPTLPGPREAKNPSYKRVLNFYFPQRREQCYKFGAFCDYAGHCWEGEKVGGQLYQIRKSHHELEQEFLDKLNGGGEGL